MKPWIPIFGIIFLIAAVAYTNLVPGTYLMGWDNVQSELHLPLNLSRSIFGVWQEYQGVGLVAGLAHPADLVHILTLLLLSVVFPNNVLRFLWTILMLFIGTIGAYILLYSLTNKRLVYAFLGSLFYLLNNATIQQFFLPYEAFSAQFAALPWLFWAIITYYHTPSRKNLFLFASIAFLASVQAYVETVFFVFLISMGIFSVVLVLYNHSKHHLLRLGKLFLVLFCVNAFWLLPFTYFFFDTSHEVAVSKENAMATPDIILENKEFGKLQNVFTLEGFLFNSVNTTADNRVTYLFTPWRDYLRLPWNKTLEYVFFLIICVGLWSALQTRKPVLIGLSILFFFTIISLTIATPPFSWINTLVRLVVPLLSETLRFPFTKFSLLAGLLYAIFFTLGLKRLLTYTFEAAQMGVGALVVVVLMIHVYPIFTGHLFYSREQPILPSDYTQLFSFFQRQNPATRIANFPQTNYWSWNDYTWQYGGSGFIWYGIPQPILDRAFDPWSAKNENYYWEVSHALLAQDSHTLLRVLKKYDVTWIVYDKSITLMQNPQLLLQTNQEKLLARVPGMHNVATFGSLDVFALSPSPSFISTTVSLPSVNSSLWNDNDTIYQQLGDYQTTTPSSLYYPFASLFTNQPNTSFSMTQDKKTITFFTPIPQQFVSSNPILVPPTIQEQFSVHISFSNIPGLAQNSVQSPIRFLATDPQPMLTITIHKKTSQYESALFQPATYVSKVASCDLFRHGALVASEQKNTLQLSATNASACLAFSADYLPHDEGYGLFVTSRHLTGKPLHLWVEDPVLHTTILDTSLPTSQQSTQSSFILPPLERFATSYTIHVENQSIGDDQTINEIGDISLSPLPYDYLKQIALGTLPSHSPPRMPISFSHPNPSTYLFTLSPTQQTIVLSQAYDSGWKAYTILNSQFSILNFFYETLPFLFGKELTTHVLINNWENGWTTTVQNGPQRIVLLFLPQYLEYVGFFLLSISPLLLVVL